MARKGQRRAPMNVMPSASPYIQDMPLGVHTHNTRPPLPQEIQAREDIDNLLSQSVPMSVLARGLPETIDQ